jgi:hypothetical protein
MKCVLDLKFLKMRYKGPFNWPFQIAYLAVVNKKRWSENIEETKGRGFSFDEIFP